MYWLPKHLSAVRILAIGVSGKAEECQTKVWGRDLKYIIGVISKKVNPNVVDHHLAQEADNTDDFIPLLVGLFQNKSKIQVCCPYYFDMGQCLCQSTLIFFGDLTSQVCSKSLDQGVIAMWLGVRSRRPHIYGSIIISLQIVAQKCGRIPLERLLKSLPHTNKQLVHKNSSNNR